MNKNSRLTDNQIRERIVKPLKATTIQRAIEHEDRIAFHVDLALSRDRVSATALNRYFSYVESLLPPDKYRLWLSLVRFPIKSVQITGPIMSDVKKVFDGQNPVLKCDFTDREYESEFEQYESAETEKWAEKAFQQMRLGINSILIVDAPAVQDTTMPEPYSYYLNIRSAVDYSTNHEDKFEWLIFRNDETHFTYVDDQYFIVYQHEKGKEKDAVAMPPSYHGVPYCPASWSNDTPVSPLDPDVKRHQLTSHLEELDFLLFLLISKNQTDLTASYPITWSYEMECDYKREDLDKGIFFRCDHALLRDRDNHWAYQPDGMISRCPVCYGSRLTGAGTHIGVPMPSKTEGDIKLGDPAGFIGADVETLKYLVSEVERRTLKLHKDITGYDRTASTTEAINATQVLSEYEVRTGILRDIKRPLERVRKWEISTKAIMRYGDKFVSCTYDMGTDFYLYDSAELLKAYSEAQKAELDVTILDFLLDQYHYTRHKNNQYAILDYEIKKNLQIYRHIPTSRIISLASTGTDAMGNEKSGVISKKDLQYILNFPTFVLKFEREQGSIVEFGRNLPFDKRINAISKIIYSYANI